MENAVTHIKDFSPEELQLITDTVAKGATKNELNLFLYRCKNLGLDPLKPGQIYFIKYGSGPGTIVVGIEGFRSKAARTGQLSGIKRGVIRNEAGICTGAWAEVYRKDWTHFSREEVSLKEYDTQRGNWVKMPETMIKKVAECAALRMAFPDDLGGVYIPEEMEQAENPIKLDQPGPEDGVQEEGVVIPYGPCAKQLVHKADEEKFETYLKEQKIAWDKRGLDSPPNWAKPMVAEAARIGLIKLYPSDADDSVL